MDENGSIKWRHQVQLGKGCWNDLCLKMPRLAASHQDPSMFTFSFTRYPLEAEHSEQILMSYEGGTGQR